MKFKYLSSNAAIYIAALLNADADDEIVANRVAVDVLRRLGVCEREEAIRYLAEAAPDVLAIIRRAYPHYD